jgi:hypothetical protein
LVIEAKSSLYTTPTPFKPTEAPLIVKRKELQGRREYQRKREEVTNHQLHIQIPKRKREEVTNNQLHPNSRYNLNSNLSRKSQLI